MTLHRNPVESVQGSGEESGEVMESTDLTKVDIAASKKEDSGTCCEKPEEGDANENGTINPNATVRGEKREDRNDGSKKKGSEAGEGDGKEDWGEEWNVDYGESLGNETHDGSLVLEGEKKKKKYRKRQNAKKREAKRAAAEQASLSSQWSV